MMTVLQACEVLQKKDGRHFFSQIMDLGNEFLLCPTNEDGDVLDIGSIPTVNKVTGEIGTFFYPKRYKELENGIEVEVPEPYKPKNKIK